MSWREQVTIGCLGTMPIHDRPQGTSGAIRMGPGDGAIGCDKGCCAGDFKTLMMGNKLMTRAIDRIQRSK